MSTHAAVLVVRDALNVMTSITDVLRTEYTVREVADAFETVEALNEQRYVCVVCRISPGMRAEAFCRLVDDAPRSLRPALVFVAGTDVSTDDLAYLHRMGANWLVERAAPGNIVALIRAVSA
jgi:DNA-binding response OmpR family regulator